MSSSWSMSIPSASIGREWIKQRRGELTVWLEPIEIPGGWWAGFEDPHGNAVYVLDQSNANEA